MKRLYLIPFLLACAACSRLPDTFPSDRNGFFIEPVSPRTRTLLSAPDVETRLSGISLAAYADGQLAASGRFTENLDRMTLSLEQGVAYNIYALVNMDGLSFPEAESSLAGLTYTLPSFQDIDTRGMPMAGMLPQFIAGKDTRTAIPAERLLARVTARLRCNWEGAAILSSRVFNMNARLLPFGESAAVSPADLLPVQEYAPGDGSASGEFVFYVPENRQGILGGIAHPRDKNPDRNATVKAQSQVLTYLETTVEASGPRSGTVTYRSYLGRDAVSDFNIIRNSLYEWNITYGEDGLALDDWKTDTGDLHTVETRYRYVLQPDFMTLIIGGIGSFYVKAYEDIYTDGILTSEGTRAINIPASDFNWKQSKPSVAYMDPKPRYVVMEGRSLGITAVTATLASDPSVVLTGQVIVREYTETETVSYELELSPAAGTVTPGETLTYTATLTTRLYSGGRLSSQNRKVLSGHDLTWTSSRSSVARIENGRALALAEGTTPITAVFTPEGEDPVSATAALTVKAKEPGPGPDPDTDAGIHTEWDEKETVILE